jgi:nucleotide-binding universal stress UspA family protein
MAIFHTILHPTDFDALSLEAFRVARELAQSLKAKVIAFHIAHPPAVVTGDGRVVMDPKDPSPVDLWQDYRSAQAATPEVTVQYAVMVGKHNEALRMLVQLIGQVPTGVLVVMGTQGRTGLSRLIWGSLAEEVVRTAPCAVLTVKEPVGDKSAAPP